MPNGLQSCSASAFSFAGSGRTRVLGGLLSKIAPPIHTYFFNNRHRRWPVLSLAAGVPGSSYPKAGAAWGPVLVAVGDLENLDAAPDYLRDLPFWLGGAW